MPNMRTVSIILEVETDDTISDLKQIAREAYGDGVKRVIVDVVDATKRKTK